MSDVSDNESDKGRFREDEKTEDISRLSEQGSEHSSDKGKGGDGAKTLRFRVQVSNLPSEYRWQGLKDLIRNEVGDVKFAKVLVGDDKPKGCGIVEFFDQKTLDKCMEKMPGFELNGQKLVVEEYVGDESDDNDEGWSRERSRRDRASSGWRTEKGRDRSADAGRDRGSLKFSACRVYVANIPYDYRWQDLKDLFRSEVGEVNFVKMFVNEYDKPKDCGIVEFSDQDSVKKCLDKMHGFKIKGRALIVKDDSGNMRDKYGHAMGAGRRGGPDEIGHRNDRGGGGETGCGGGWGNTYGLSMNFLDSLNINGPLSSRVFVGNLDYKVDKKKLKEVFRLAGRIVRIDLPSYKDGHIKGYGVIEFEHPVEAVQAISLFHEQFLYDRPMNVRMDQVNNAFKLPEGLRGIGMGLGTQGEPLKDVIHNLPSLSSCNQGVSNNTSPPAPVPTAAIQAASTLPVLNNIVGNSALNNLLSNASVLQATLSNVFGKALGAGDLSSLMQNPSQLIGNNVNTPNSFSFNSSPNVAPVKSFDPIKASGFGVGNDFPIGGQSANSNIGGANRFSNKVVISNIPPTAGYKALHSKFSEFGEVQLLDKKDNDDILVVYNSEWEAERAIKNLDNARVDGRTIEARFYY